MRIKEFLIVRYGPLPNTGRIQLGRFNLFFGKNEYGKTLTIDALIKLLFGQNIKGFPKDINRVKELPEGYVIIEDDMGKEYKLPEKGDLTRLVGLTISECQNIFIIRNSNLSIAREAEFYTNVTDRLTGLRTEEICRIKDSLREIGNITPKGEFQDIKGTKLKTRIEDARNLIRKVEAIIEKNKEERIDELEKERIMLKDELDGIQQKLENLEDTRKREKYEKGKDALERLEEALKRLEELELFNEEDEWLWRDCERDIQAYTRELGELFTNLEDLEREFNKITDELSNRERAFRILEGRKRDIDEDIKPALKSYKEDYEELILQEGRTRFFTTLGIISTVLLAISLIGAIINPSPLFITSSLLFSILSMVLGFSKWRFIRTNSYLRMEFERIKSALSVFELGSEDIEGILSNIQKFDEIYRENMDELQNIKRRRENLENQIKNLRERTIPSKERIIKDAQDKIDKLRRKSREETLQSYTQKLQLKRELESMLGEKRGILENLFEREKELLRENIPYWREKLKELEDYKDKAQETIYDEKTVIKLKEEKKQCGERLNSLRVKLDLFQKKLEEIEREANRILQLEGDYLHCKTSVDLYGVLDKLQKFIEENEITRDNVLEAIRLFEEIEREEVEKVAALFGRESPVTRYFNRITEGIYVEVLFEQESGAIEVKLKSGAILRAEKLSGGAYDQLYLSIRLALGEKLLKGKTGFFIMDDPFIKSDPDRLKRQFDVLKKISDSGWQVLFFSAKGEVRDYLAGDIAKNAINYIEIQGIFT